MLFPSVPLSSAKRLKSVALVMFFIGIFFFLSLFDSSNTLAADDTITVMLDNEQMSFTINPTLQEGTTLVQMRPLFEELNMDVKYDSKTKKVTAEKEGYSLELTLNSTTAFINGKQEKLLRPPTVIKGNTLVPVRFVSEATGALVHWNGPGQEIIVFSEDFIQTTGMTKQEVKDYLAELQNDINKQHEELKKEEERKKQEEERKKLPKVNLSKLQGMYYGAEMDLGGYECGGICWKFYTFLSGNRVVIGEPTGGGPKTVDCKKDTCLTYKISNGKINLSNGQSMSIKSNDYGGIVIDSLPLERVKSVGNSFKLNGEYKTFSYSGLVGVAPISTSQTKYMSFKSDGTFTSDHIFVKAADNPNLLRGAYTINGNTITLNYSGGQKQTKVFIAERDSSGRIATIQIGDRSFDLTKRN